MNENENSRLEAAVDRELKALPNLRAPRRLLPRVMVVLEQRAVLPWYRREWQTWPLALQCGSLGGLLGAFAFLCFESSRLAYYAMLTPAAREVTGWFGLADAVCGAGNALTRALGIAFHNLGPAPLIGGAAMLLLCYLMCLGLGTIYWRLAYARR